MFGNLEWGPDQVPPVKLGLHIAQVLFTFVIFCLEISVFTSKGSAIIGKNGWTFGVCFLSIPAWVYLAMAPRFPRTRRLANPHVMACIDGLYTILWLSAFATQASYNTAGLCGKACGRSKAVVGLGFFVFLFFAATTFISIYTVQYYKWNGTLPGYENIKPRAHNIDPDKAAFSMAPHDEEAYAPVGMDDHDIDHHGSSHPDEHGYVGGSQAGAYSDHGSYGRGSRYSAHDNPFENESDYHLPQQQAGSSIYAPPSVHDDYDDQRPARFPAADYDRVTR